MGNCNIEKPQPIYINHSKEDVEAHFMSLIQLEHFEKRESTLKNQALDDFNRIINTSLDLIKVRRQHVLNSFSQQIKDTQEDEKLMKKLRKNNLSVEEYVGYADTQLTANLYQQEKQQEFESIKEQLQLNMNKTFQSIKQDIESKKVDFEETEMLTKEDINNKFYKWKISNRDKVKLAALDIQNRFKDELTHDYFRNKLKQVVSSEDVKQNIVKSNPRVIRTKSEVEIETQDFVGSTVDTGKSWFCCVPRK